MSGPPIAIVTCVLGLGLGFFLLVGFLAGNSDSIRSCSVACSVSGMASYTEAKVEYPEPAGLRTTLVPVCACK